VAPRISIDRRLMKVAMISALRTGRIYLQDKSLVPISVRGRFDPRAIVQLEKNNCVFTEIHFLFRPIRERVLIQY